MAIKFKLVKKISKFKVYWKFHVPTLYEFVIPVIFPALKYTSRPLILVKFQNYQFEPKLVWWNRSRNPLQILFFGPPIAYSLLMFDLIFNTKKKHFFVPREFLLAVKIIPSNQVPYCLNLVAIVAKMFEDQKTGNGRVSFFKKSFR